MFFKLPVLFIDNKYSDNPLKYKWNKRIDDKIESGDHGNFLDIIKKINHKAAFGLATAASEWVLWRIYPYKDSDLNRNIEFYFNFTEVHWLSLLDKKYLRIWRFSDSFKNYEGNKIESPLWTIARKFTFLRKDYEISSALIYPEMTTIILLARHISENEALFDSWLTGCLKKAILLFPNKQPPTGGTVNGYDNTQEPPIPREFFFEPNFDYEQVDIKKLKAELLAQMGSEHHEFLTIPANNEER